MLSPQGVISEVTAEHNREMLFKANEDFIVLVQAHVRGYLTRRAFRERMEFLSQQLPAITTIQVHTAVVFVIASPLPVAISGLVNSTALVALLLSCFVVLYFLFLLSAL